MAIRVERVHRHSGSLPDDDVVTQAPIRCHDWSQPQVTATVDGQKRGARACPTHAPLKINGPPIPRLLQFSLDSAVFPPWIIAGQPQHQVPDLVADRWPGR